MIYDNRGVPAHHGDVIKIYHFTGKRKKRYYMYKVVQEVETYSKRYLHAVDATELVTKPKGPFRSLLKNIGEFEIVQGYGPKPYIDFEDRPRRPKETAT
jgi:hypothetical protein